jgi:hypothetical protein
MRILNPCFDTDLALLCLELEMESDISLGEVGVEAHQGEEVGEEEVFLMEER